MLHLNFLAALNDQSESEQGAGERPEVVSNLPPQYLILGRKTGETETCVRTEKFLYAINIFSCFAALCKRLDSKQTKGDVLDAGRDTMACIIENYYFGDFP